MNKHADLIEQYCQDWKETDRPWLRWQYRNDSSIWDDLGSHPRWDDETQYQRKPNPKLITLGGIEFPEPLREPPQNGAKVFYPTYYSDCDSVEWYNTAWQCALLQYGLIQATKEGAELQSQAILSALRQAIDE